MDEGEHRVGKSQWTVLQWAVGTAIAAAAVIAALGGPEEAWIKTRAAVWGHPEPKIISVESAPRRPSGSYIVTLRNPALEDVVIVGYRATPRSLAITGDAAASWGENVAVSASDNGAVTVMDAEEQPPERCAAMRHVALPRPLIIEARGARALQLRPWQEPCVFSITILSDHGESAPSVSISGFEP